MQYLLDTNAWIMYLKDPDSEVRKPPAFCFASRYGNEVDKFVDCPQLSI